MKFAVKPSWSVLSLAVAALVVAACGDGGDIPVVTNPSSTPVVALAAPTMAFTAPGEAIDLANYTQTGRYALPTALGANLLATEASAVTYNKDTDTLFVAGDGSTAIVQVNKRGQLIDSMTLAAGSSPQGTDFYDVEGLTYVGNGRFVMVEERDRQVNQFTYAANTTLSRAGAKTVKLGTTIGNIGIEGVGYDPLSGGFIAVKETGPQGIFQTSVDFTALTATVGSPTTDNPPNLFDPAKSGLSTFNDVYALSNILTTAATDYSHLLLISGTDGRLVKVDRLGNLQGGSIDVGAATQSEGVTMDASRVIYVVNEQGGGSAVKPELFVYTPTTDASAVGVGSNLYLSFAQPIVLGSGNITLSNGAGDVRTIPVTDTSQVSIRGTSTLVINPKADLLAGSSYSVQYAAGIVKDTSGNGVAAMTSTTTFALKTRGTLDITAPTLASSLPANNASGITSSQIVLTFSETVVAGSGTITLSNGTDTRSLSVADAAQVIISGGVVTINPATALVFGTSYYVQISPNALRDTAGNSFAGIADTTTLRFTLGATAPTTLAVGDILFIAANTSGTTGSATNADSFAVVLMRDVGPGTQIGFTDKNYTATGTPTFPTNEGVFIWTADVAYPAGTVITLQPDQAAATAPLANRGTVVGIAGGLSATAETIYAFQGTVVGLTNSAYGTINVARFIAAMNIGVAAGDIPPELVTGNAYISFPLDNNIYTGSLNASNIATLRSLVTNAANWASRDTTTYPVNAAGSLFP